MNSTIQELVCSVVCFVRISLPVMKLMNKKQQFIVPPDNSPRRFRMCFDFFNRMFTCFFSTKIYLEVLV